MSRQSFESVVGSAFQVSPTSANSQPVWLTLVAVHDLPGLAPVNVGSMAVPPPKSTSPAPTTTGFMLSFNSSAAPLSQGTYTFQHEKLGQFALFIVPGAPGMQSYTAVFNLLNGATPAPPHFIPPGKLRPAVGTDNAGESNNAVGSSNTGGLEGGGRPAQQTLEPVLRNGLEPKLPE